MLLFYSAIQLPEMFWKCVRGDTASLVGKGYGACCSVSYGCRCSSVLLPPPLPGALGSHSTEGQQELAILWGANSKNAIFQRAQARHLKHTMWFPSPLWQPMAHSSFFHLTTWSMITVVLTIISFMCNSGMPPLPNIFRACGLSVLTSNDSLFLPSSVVPKLSQST